MKQQAQALLDHLMNDEYHQQEMNKWISQHWNYSTSIEEALKEENEDTPLYDLYYEMTVIYHTKVLAESILSLRN